MSLNYSMFGTPWVARRGGRLPLIYQDCFSCRLMKPDPFSSFELQMTKLVSEQEEEDMTESFAGSFNLLQLLS